MHGRLSRNPASCRERVSLLYFLTVRTGIPIVLAGSLLTILMVWDGLADLAVSYVIDDFVEFRAGSPNRRDASLSDHCSQVVNSCLDRAACCWFIAGRGVRRSGRFRDCRCRPRASGRRCFLPEPLPCARDQNRLRIGVRSRSCLSADPANPSPTAAGYVAAVQIGSSRMSDGDSDIQPEIAEYGPLHSLFKSRHIRLTSLSCSIVDALDDRQTVGRRGVQPIG